MHKDGCRANAREAVQVEKDSRRTGYAVHVEHPSKAYATHRNAACRRDCVFKVRESFIV